MPRTRTGGWTALTDSSAALLPVSSDGVRWRSPASGVGTGQLSTVDVPRTRARFLRITSTASAGNRWSIAGIRLYA